MTIGASYIALFYLTENFLPRPITIDQLRDGLGFIYAVFVIKL